MSTEVATLNDSAIDLLPAAQPPSLAARQMLMAHAEMYQTAHELAGAMVRTAMVPQRFMGAAKQGDAAAAILYGAELGLNPIQSLQRVIPIHGMPSIEARTMVALLKSRGYKVWTSAQSDESVTVCGRDLDGDVYESTWTIERAIQAGYVPTPTANSQRRPNVLNDWEKNSNGKLAGNMKYITDPQTMLKAKGQSEVCREMAPDVLLGISYTSEELQSERFEAPAAEPQQRGSAVVTADEIMGTAPQGQRPAMQEAECAEEVPIVAEPGSDAERYAEQNLTGADAVAYLTGQRPAGEDEPPNGYVPADPEPTAVEPEPLTAPAPAAEDDPAPEKPKTAKRKALEKRLFGLLNQADLEDREDRMIVYRAITVRVDVNSTDDLSDDEVAAVCDQLFAWSEAGQLGDQVTDILNSAALAEEEAKNTTTTEGN